MLDAHRVLLEGDLLPRWAILRPLRRLQPSEIAGNEAAQSLPGTPTDITAKQLI